jgi:hypothetical protein
LIGQRRNRCHVIGGRGRTQRSAEKIAESVNGGCAIADLIEVGAKCATNALEALAVFVDAYGIFQKARMNEIYIHVYLDDKFMAMGAPPGEVPQAFGQFMFRPLTKLDPF